MAKICKIPECTVADTGICLLNNAPDSCPNIGDGASSQGAPAGSELAGPVLEAPKQLPTFRASESLDLDAVRRVMATRPHVLIGLLGAPDSGKTSFLVSLFLLLSKGESREFAYCDSDSLMALDYLSRGAREWADSTPEQLTAHTELADGRTAGFVHLAVIRRSDSKRFDLLIPDLPGEWTTSLIDSARADRWSFLDSTDVLWIFVDGRYLIDVEVKQATIHRLQLLIRRIADLAQQRKSVFLVETRLDAGDVSADVRAQLQGYALGLGIELTCIGIASFSKSETLTAGSGVFELLSLTLETSSDAGNFWPEGAPLSGDCRSILKYGNTR